MRFLQNFAWVRKSRGPGLQLHSHAEFHHCSFKNVALRSQKSPKMYASVGGFKFLIWLFSGDKQPSYKHFPSNFQ